MSRNTVRFFLSMYLLYVRKIMAIDIPIFIDKTEYRIQTDAYNWQLCKRINKKDKETGEIEDEWQGFKFFNCLEYLLNYILNEKIRKEDIKTLEELKQNIIKTKQEITQVYNTNITKGK